MTTGEHTRTGAAQPGPLPSLSRAWYHAAIGDFTREDPDRVIGQLTRRSDFPVTPSQRDAWLEQVDYMQEVLAGLDSPAAGDGAVYFEFNIPRMGRRIDVVLVMGSVVYAIEFKAGISVFERAGMDQVWDYALDLKYFHSASHDVAIVPVLVAMGARECPPIDLQRDRDGVFRPVQVTRDRLPSLIIQVLRGVHGEAIDPSAWLAGTYMPTPTIVEAARALYAQHSVDAIARHDAGAKNLQVTSLRIEELVDNARANNEKVICFVTGVPGAGKTLVGLNVATQRRDETSLTHAVFLSGNGPLVKVLCEALTRDEYDRQKAADKKPRKGQIRNSVKAFIQNVHHFRDEALRDPGPPADHVAIFDEAQRAWNLRQTANFMQRKKNQPGFNQSEPEFLISYLDRHPDWAAIICLVGGGQEINTGEAGIEEWVTVVAERFPHWKMVISANLTEREYGEGRVIRSVAARPGTHFDEALHLSVSMRSFRAERLSDFVKAMLDCDTGTARELFEGLSERYPIRITRDLDAAKAWIRRRARGSERYGLVASSKAQRLKPHAIDIRVDIDPVHWFLNDRTDPRSSYYLEDAATEFQVQGLELDWVCVTWDGDLRMQGDGWSYHDFRGDKWTNIHNEDKRRYTLNAYRVLLTRARQGMVIFVPPGNAQDPTRSAEYYDGTYEMLCAVGVPELG